MNSNFSVKSWSIWLLLFEPTVTRRGRWGTPGIGGRPRPTNALRTGEIVTDRISRLFHIDRVNTIYWPTRSMQLYLMSVKHTRHLLASSGLYRIHLLVRAGVYWNHEAQCGHEKKHRRSCSRIYRTEMLPVLEHILAESNYNVRFEETNSSLHLAAQATSTIKKKT